MNRQDDEIDDGSSSGAVDEGRRGVAVDDVVREEAPARWRTEEGVGLRGFSRPRCTNGWADGMGGGNHGLGTRLSKMWGKLRKYPHRFELGGSFGSGVSLAFHVSGFRRRWEFSRAL
jgi:hypothetical protein